MKILIAVTCHRLLNRTKIVKKFIDDFNNSIHLSVKACKKFFEVLIHFSYPNVDDN